MRVLLIEDSKRLQRSIGEGLRKEGFAVDWTGDGEEGLWYAETNDYDVIILDLMLPGLDGLTVLRKLREQGKSTHVLILTAKSSVENRVLGLTLGADDYLVKPFAFEELVARIKALGRRSYGAKNPKIRFGEIELDTDRRVATRSGQPIHLTPKEYAILEYLVYNHGIVVSRSQIESHIYDDRVDPMSNVVDAVLCTLRKKIDRPGEPSLIQTRRGMGYILEVAQICDPSGAS